MRKLKLRIDDLRVDSFGTGEAKTQGGTVHARSGAPGCAVNSFDWCQATAGYTLCPECPPSCVTNGGQPGTGCGYQEYQIAV